MMASFVAYIVSFINSFLAFFNLLPFGMMDGLKVWNWHKGVYALAMGLAIGLQAVHWVYL